LSQNRNSVVFLHVAITEKSGAVVERTGTGSIISDSGYVLTSYHVVMKNAQDDAEEPIITGAPGSAEAEPKSMLLIDTRRAQDLALLQFKDTSRQWPSVKVHDPDQLSPGAELCSSGFPAVQDAIPPRSYEYHVSHGVLSGKGGPHGWWTTDMPSNPGESGAPVFDREGGLVAVKYGGDEKAQNINVIIPINLASMLLIAANVPLPTANSPHPPIVPTQRYKPSDSTIPSAGAMDTLVTRNDLGGQYRLAISFTVPPDPHMIPGPFPFNLITVYGFRRYGPNGTSRTELPPSTFPSTQGNWNSGDRVTISVDVPKQFSDPVQGWEVRFCVGSSKGCIPSPNLLTGSPIP
jgi:hypothetical protein